MRVVELDAGRGASPVAPLARDFREEEPTLGDYLATLIDNRALVAICAVAALVVAGFYVVLAAPTWRSDVLLQVQDKTKGIAGLDDLADTFSEKSLADTEIEILRSRSLLGSVVDQLNLTVETQPRTFPVFGGAVFRRYERKHPDDGVSGAFLGLSSFAWGGERLQIAKLQVPEDLLDQKLSLAAGAGGRFELFDPEGELLVAGEAGKAAARGEGRRRTEILVSSLQARPGTRFRVVKRHRDGVIDDLQAELRVSEKGKKTGIISASLEGKERAQIIAILDAVARNYVRQNIDLKSSEAAKTLEFVQQQLPVVRKNADITAAAFKAYQEGSRSVDLDAETQAVLERSVEIEKALSQLALDRAELRQRFTASHPSLVGLQAREDQLKAEKAGLESKLHRLPKQSQESVSLSRDAKVASDLYILLLNKAQELEVVKSGTIGNVRVLDTALEPFEPVSPKKILVLPLALLLGLFGGIGAAFLRKAMDQGVDDPVEIEQAIGISVYASVPHSPHETELARQRTLPGATPSVLAMIDAGDLAVESMRSLRTALQFALVDAPSKIISISGPSPEVGKSFLAANLSHVLAQAGKRVLLIDCDLRRGQLHRYLGGTRGIGVSEIVSGQCQVAEAARKTALETLDFISTGKLPPNPSELIASPRFQAFLGDVAARYDLVLIDLPPILAVTDAAIGARYAGVNLLVLRSGKHPMGEIAMAVKHFANAGITMHGVVLNGVFASTGRYSRYAHQHHYHYAYRSDPKS